MSSLLTPAQIDALAGAASKSDRLTMRLELKPDHPLPMKTLADMIGNTLRLLNSVERELTQAKRARTNWVLVRISFDGSALEYTMCSEQTWRREQAPEVTP